jgi:3'-phosphoadenosine 5'-phosphosulfate sulfotransferase (PAPS reductase)/FAD synthetase
MAHPIAQLLKLNTNTPRPGDTIVVWFSCGAASAVAAKLTLEKYGNLCDIRVVNNPVKEEDEDNQRFLKDVEKWIGVPIELAVNEKYPSCSAFDVWQKRKYMSGVKGAPCTLELKKVARQQWESRNHHDWLVLGFTAEEHARFDRFKLTERDNILPILIDAGVTKKDCFDILLNAGITIPRIYLQGYPNANCIGCVKSSSPSYWALVRREHPHVFQQRVDQSREIGCKLIKIKGKWVYLDELPIDQEIKNLSKLNFECGIFCEERK